MAFNKRTWLGRQGTGLNKFSIGGATPVTIVNQPDSVTQVGDALSAGNLNDLEDRIESAFNAVGTQIETELAPIQTSVDNLGEKTASLQKQIDNITEAENLLSEVDYANGETAVPANVSKYAEVSVLKGVGRVANNLLYVSAMPTLTSNGVTFTSNGDGTITVSGTATGGNATYSLFSVLNSAKSYLWGGCPSGGSASTYFIGTSASYADVGGGMLRTFPASGLYYILITVIEGTTVNFTCKPFVVDLAVYFNTTDLSFLGATDSAKLATIQQNYPELLEPSDYGTSAVFPTYTAVKSVGRNLWDEVYEEGDINYNTGVPQGNSNYIRSVNFCKVAANTSIYVKANNTIWLLWYDANYNYLGGTASDGTAGGTVVTSPANARFFKLVNRKIVFDGKICINKSDSQNGTYTPYFTATLTLPEPITLKGAGSAAEEYYPETGRVTHPLGSVDLGSLSWTKYQTRFYATISDAYYSSDNTINLLCEKYIPKAEDSQGYMWLYTGRIYIHDENYANEFAFKSAMDGVILYYELATPSADTYVDPLPDNYIKVEPNGTIETVQSQSPKVDGAMTVTYTNKLTA